MNAGMKMLMLTNARGGRSGGRMEALKDNYARMGYDGAGAATTRKAGTVTAGEGSITTMADSLPATTWDTVKWKVTMVALRWAGGVNMNVWRWDTALPRTARKGVSG